VIIDVAFFIVAALSVTHIQCLLGKNNSSRQIRAKQGVAAGAEAEQDP
jgi:hypothetical protein